MTDTDRRLREPDSLGTLRFDERGLLPVIAQDARDGAVLMVGWADRQALTRSLETGFLHFWSRSRGELWKKGETSGNTLAVRGLHADCDGDALLALVEPAGPACHSGERTCFGSGAVPDAPPQGLPVPGDAAGDAPANALDALWDVLASRERERPEGSYTVRLLEDENLRLKKLGEEHAELISALAKGDRDRVRAESADLVYHLLVALLAAGVSLADVRAELARRG